MATEATRRAVRNTVDFEKNGPKFARVKCDHCRFTTSSVRPLVAIEAMRDHCEAMRHEMPVSVFLGEQLHPETVSA